MMVFWFQNPLCIVHIQDMDPVADPITREDLMKASFLLIVAVILGTVPCVAAQLDPTIPNPSPLGRA